MKLSTLQKFGGVALILGSVLLAVYSFCFFKLLPINEVRHDMTGAILNSNWIWIAAVAFIGVFFMIFGFTALYSRLYKDSGIIGFLGYILVEIAYILQACKVTWEIYLYPTMAANEGSVALFRDSIIKNSSLVMSFRSLASFSIFAGIILFSTALIRSKEFPKIGGILVLTGAVLYGFGPMLSISVALGGIIILSIGCLILGAELIRNQETKPI